MKKMTGSFMLASALTLGAIAVPTILAASNEDSPTVEVSGDTKTALDEIRVQEETGEITHEEAHAKMVELGIKRPFGKGGHRGGGPFGNMDKETRTTIDDIRDQFKAGDLTEEEAQAKVEALGLDFNFKMLSRGPHEELTDEQKAQLAGIRDQVEAGTLTEEEARTQMKELGFKPRGGHGGRGHNGPRGNFQSENAPADDTETQATNTTSEA